MKISPVRMQGLVEAVGVSNYGPKQMQKIHRYRTSPSPRMTHAYCIAPAVVATPLCRRGCLPV